MTRKAIVLAALLGLFLRTASAQSVKDVRSVLEASLKAMGGANLKTIRYTASGWSSRVGQTYGLAEDWRRYEVADYTRVINYEAKWSREVTHFNEPVVAGGQVYVCTWDGKIYAFGLRK